jgi:hypothetical protein
LIVKSRRSEGRINEAYDMGLPTDFVGDHLVGLVFAVIFEGGDGSFGEGGGIILHRRTF